MQTCYSEHYENAWSCPSKMIVSPCRKLWCLQCWNQLVGKFDVYLHSRNQLHLWLLFWDVVESLQTWYFGNSGNAGPFQSKIIVSICGEPSCLTACKKINFITHFFLKILQRNNKLVILGNLGMPGHKHIKWYQFEEIFNVYL